jgi:hypothetical protein
MINLFNPLHRSIHRITKVDHILPYYTYTDLLLKLVFDVEWDSMGKLELELEHSFGRFYKKKNKS